MHFDTGGMKKKNEKNLIIKETDEHQLHNSFSFLCQVHIEITAHTEGYSLPQPHAHTMSAHLGITHNNSYIILQREAPAALVTEHRQYIENGAMSNCRERFILPFYIYLEWICNQRDS